MLYKRYRTPVMGRYPILRRSPITGNVVQDTIVRSPIGGRIKCESCTICDRTCEGREFVPYDDYVSDRSIFRLVRINNLKDLDTAAEKVSTVGDNYKFCRIVSDEPLDDDTIKALSYSHYNVAQLNINAHTWDRLDEFVVSSRKAKSHGLYTVAMFYGILPGVVALPTLLKVVERLHHSVRHFVFKFFDEAIETTPIEDHCLINDSMVPNVFLDHAPNRTFSKHGYIATFMARVEKILRPRKIGYSVCNEEECY